MGKGEHGTQVERTAEAAAADAAQLKNAQADAAGKAAGLLEKLSLAESAVDARQKDAEAVAKFVKEVGVDSPAAAAVYENVTASLQMNGKDKAPNREGACYCFGALLKENGAAVLPYLAEAAPLVFSAFADKVKSVQVAAADAVEGMANYICPYTAKAVLPTLCQSIDTKEKPPTIVAGLDVLQAMIDSAPEQIGGHCMPDLVPVITALMTEIRPEIRDESRKLLTELCDTIDNVDIEELIPELIASYADVSKASDCLHKLAATTFVSTVQSNALAIIAPLLDRGFRERSTASKRQCAVIVANMTKLVDEPANAAPFLPKLYPQVETTARSISDPEARKKCEEAFDHLTRIKDAVEAWRARDIPGHVAACVSKNTKSENKIGLDFASEVVLSLIQNKVYSEDVWVKTLTPYLTALRADDAAAAAKAVLAECAQYMEKEAEVDEDADAEELCNCKFTLAYGTKILLHNTNMTLKRGLKYGLLGGNDSGKTTLMRSIANGQVEGFPSAEEVRTVFVAADIIGEMAEMNIVDYVLADPRIKAAGVPKETIVQILGSVGFTEVMMNGPVTFLSGGWRMKLALARAMLLKADILLMDEPTNHLDVVNVQWVKNYLNSLTNVTCIIVSHDSGLLNDVCTNIIEIKDLKLIQTKGNLSEYMKKNPHAMSFFELKSNKMKFRFPQPGPIEGIKTKGKFLMKMDKCTFTYPSNTVPTIRDITVRVSMASRVACVGRNGAGKSTMIKLLTGELVPQEGDVWKHPACRVAYVAQHAFQWIESHLDKTANEYIRWRYENGEDKENIRKESLSLSEEELAKLKEPVEFTIKVNEKVTKIKKVIKELTRQRRTNKKEKVDEYEVKFVDGTVDWLDRPKLMKLGWHKHLKMIDDRIALSEGMYKKALTKANVEQHLEDVGLDKEFGTHYRMGALSGGQKVKVVIGAALWNQPHIIILDEPTNYLDRESLGAMADAIRVFEGGIVMISHNSQFVSELCPETWVLEDGKLETKGDPEWMKSVMNEKVEVAQVTEMVDALGNTVEVKKQKKKMSRKERKAYLKRRQHRIDNGEEVSSEEEWEE